MEWWVKKVRKNSSTATTCVVLQSGQIVVIAEIESRCSLQEGDKLTPGPNALYYINNNGAATLRVISASNFSAERWAQTA
ncbi:TPA: histidine kinase [Klebsiella aerogenes]|nr:histidine kinase [Klebsiella aerogenes]